MARILKGSWRNSHRERAARARADRCADAPRDSADGSGQHSLTLRVATASGTQAPVADHKSRPHLKHKRPQHGNFGGTVKAAIEADGVRRRRNLHGAFSGLGGCGEGQCRGTWTLSTSRPTCHSQAGHISAAMRVRPDSRVCVKEKELLRVDAIVPEGLSEITGGEKRRRQRHTSDLPVPSLSHQLCFCLDSCLRTRAQPRARSCGSPRLNKWRGSEHRSGQRGRRHNEAAFSRRRGPPDG
jgi:hypothetical protein